MGVQRGALERSKLVSVAIGRPQIPVLFRRTETRFFAKDFYKSADLKESLQGIVNRDFDEERVRVEYVHSVRRKKKDI
jgi:hypothetical protein